MQLGTKYPQQETLFDGPLYTILSNVFVSTNVSFIGMTLIWVDRQEMEMDHMQRGIWQLGVLLAGYAKVTSEVT